MGVQLKYTGVTLPANVGQTFYGDDGGLTDGSLLLLDFSNPLCLPATATNAGGANNLAAAPLDALVGSANGITPPATATDFPLTAGRGMYKTSGVSGGIFYPILRSDAFEAYLRTNMPDVLTTFWVRITPSSVTVKQDGIVYGDASKVPALWRLLVEADGTVEVTNQTPIPASLMSNQNSWLFHIAMSRTEFFVNGQKAGDLPQQSITRYDEFVAAVGTTTNDVMWVFRGPGQGNVDGAFRIYRMLMEDLDASGRTALQAAKAEYDYVIANASFVGTV
ncbi:MAG: hypothetical protein AAFO77_00700 [Pseudomonadota bacterium]